MKFRSLFAALAILIFCAGDATAQGVATVAAVRQALVDAIERLDTALSNQTGNVKSIGEGLTGNARSLLADFDSRLGQKLQYTFEKLDDQEKKLFADARAVVAQMNQAANDVVDRVGETAKMSLAEADILAYNSLYGLPCRSQVPRVIYVKPERVAANDVREVTLRGNFLAIGAEPAILVESIAVKPLARSDNEIRIPLPAGVFANLTAEHSISVALTPRQRVRTNLWVTCWDSEKDGRPLSAAVRVVPTTEVTVTASIAANVEVPTTYDIPYNWTEHNDDCNANYNVTKEFKVPDDSRLLGYSAPGVSCSRCGSGVNGTRQTSDKSIVVDAHFQACGTDCVNLLVGKICNCKGSGCLAYSGALHAEKYAPTVTPPHTEQQKTKGIRQRSFLFKYEPPLPTGARNLRWSYEVIVEKIIGNSVEKHILSDTNPTSGVMTSRIGTDGKLMVDIGAL
ncbi:hypothetical protein ACFPN2_02295 [Steroidobacter flavus]|uniref:Gliding motility-associated protein GldM n=1 Tax=Steroidobacter flavus TaxID=1842136 RepID=A0ABV8SKN7_9GAMM